MNKASLMIKMTIRVKPHSNAQKEFEQTLVGIQIDDTHISGLIEKWRTENGCICYLLHRENEDEFCLESEWLSREELEDHFRGKGFTLLMGAIDVLCETPEVNITDGKSSLGMEFIKSVLEK